MYLEDATDDACRDLLEHHAAVLEFLDADPAALPAAAFMHCANFKETLEAPTLKTTLSLLSYHFEPSFLWAHADARRAVVAWARNAFVVQQATTNKLFAELPDDCAGDVLDFLEMAMPRTESLEVASHCSSPKARAWVQAILAAAAMVRIIDFFDNDGESRP